MNKYSIEFEFEGKTKTCIRETKSSSICCEIYFTKDLKPLSDITTSGIITTFDVHNEPKYIMRILKRQNIGYLEQVELFEVVKISYFSNLIYIKKKEIMEAEKAEEVYMKCKQGIIKNIDSIRGLKDNNKNMEKVTLEDVIYAYALMHFKLF